jgi:hypothetical protein
MRGPVQSPVPHPQGFLLTFGSLDQGESVDVEMG